MNDDFTIWQHVKGFIYRSIKHKWDFNCCYCGKFLHSIRTLLPNQVVFDTTVFCDDDCLTGEVEEHRGYMFHTKPVEDGA